MLSRPVSPNSEPLAASVVVVAPATDFSVIFARVAVTTAL